MMFSFRFRPSKLVLWDDDMFRPADEQQVETREGRINDTCGEAAGTSAENKSSGELPAMMETFARKTFRDTYVTKGFLVQYEGEVSLVL